MFCLHRLCKHNRVPVFSSKRVASMAIHLLCHERMDQADIVITPDLKGMPYLSDKYNQPMYDAGVKAVREMMPR